MDREVSTRVTMVKRPPTAGGRGCLVVMHPADEPLYGHRIELAERVTIGRGPSNDIVLDNDAASRRHCRIERDEEGWVVSDEGSKNGTFVGDAEIRRVRLKPGDKLHVGTAILKYLAGDDLELQFIETAHRMAIQDPLTELPNRRALDQAMIRELARARRTASPLCVALLDVDKFKRVNDRFGHVAGDMVLRELAAILAEQMRAGDILAKYGGEELAIVLPDTKLDEAITLCERLRSAVAAHAFESRKGRVPVTFSAGVAQVQAGMNAEGLFEAADRRLYDAKEGGRNRVEPALRPG